MTNWNLGQYGTILLLVTEIYMICLLIIREKYAEAAGRLIACILWGGLLLIGGFWK